MTLTRGGKLGHRIPVPETPVATRVAAKPAVPKPAAAARVEAGGQRNDIEAWHAGLVQRAQALMQKRVRCEAALEEAERQERELLRKAKAFGAESLADLERKVVEQEAADRAALAAFEKTLDEEEAAQAEVERELRELGD